MLPEPRLILIDVNVVLFRIRIYARLRLLSFYVDLRFIDVDVHLRGRFYVSFRININFEIHVRLVPNDINANTATLLLLHRRNRHLFRKRYEPLAPEKEIKPFPTSTPKANTYDSYSAPQFSLLIAQSARCRTVGFTFGNCRSFASPAAASPSRHSTN